MPAHLPVFFTLNEKVADFYVEILESHIEPEIFLEKGLRRILSRIFVPSFQSSIGPMRTIVKLLDPKFVEKIEIRELGRATGFPPLGLKSFELLRNVCGIPSAALSARKGKDR